MCENSCICEKTGCGQLAKSVSLLLISSQFASLSFPSKMRLGLEIYRLFVCLFLGYLRFDPRFNDLAGPRQGFAHLQCLADLASSKWPSLEPFPGCF